MSDDRFYKKTVETPSRTRQGKPTVQHFIIEVFEKNPADGKPFDDPGRRARDIFNLCRQNDPFHDPKLEPIKEAEVPSTKTRVYFHHDAQIYVYDPA